MGQDRIKTRINEAIIKDLSGLINPLGYGTVTITVHGSRITQIEIAEKKRYNELQVNAADRKDGI